MRTASWLSWMMAVAGLALVSGCQAPAQILWSPDGNTAAYRGNARLLLLDLDGKVLSDLGKSDGGIAWTKDSKTLYYLTETDTGEAATLDASWLITSKSLAPATQPADATPGKKEMVELKALDSGKSTVLCRFNGDVLHMMLSPDEKWLAMMCMGAEPTEQFCVLAYYIPTQRLYTLSDNAGMAMCFTGPSRLLIEEQDTRAPAMASVPGKLVELTLDPAAAPKVESLLSVMPGDSFWMAALGDNVLFTSVRREYPGKMIDKKQETISLFQWTRANGGVVSCADGVGPLFAVSPDGQRVLIERVTRDSDQSREKHLIEVIRANGSDGHVLRDLSPYNQFAIWPAWRGNDEITFTNPTAEGKNASQGSGTRIQYEVVHFKLNDKSELEALRTLSTGWADGDKPFIKIDETGPTTQPTSRP